MNIMSLSPKYKPKELRPYQNEAVEHALTDWYVYRKRATLITLATGGGKTLVAAEAIKLLFKAGRCLFVAHREELIDQAAARIEEHLGVKPGIEMGKRRSSADDRIVIASVQTLAKRSIPGDKFLLVIVDECHHAPAPMHNRVLDELDAEYELHLSATPFRTDSRTLAARIDGGEYKAGLLDLIQAGYLADVKVHSIPVTIDMSKVRTLAGEFRLDDVAEALNEDGKLPQLANWVAEHASNRRMLTFCPRIDVSRQWAHLLWERGLRSAHIDGKSPDRKELLEAFENGEITHLSNADLLLEGYDNPRADTLLMLRAVQSPIVFAQAVGRVTRKHIDKDYALLLDPLFQGARKAQQAFGVEFGDDPRFKRIRLLMTARGLSFKEAVIEDERLEQEARAEASVKMAAAKQVSDKKGVTIEDHLTEASDNEEALQNLVDILGETVRKQPEMRTDKQFWYLHYKGVDASCMTKAQAGRAIGDIKARETIASFGPVPTYVAPAPARETPYVPSRRDSHPWEYL